MSRLPTTFERTADLARLPWFDLVDGRLTLDPSIGPVIDFHSHLALTYLRRSNVDLRAATPTSLTYLPAAAPMDLDVYANRNLAPVDMAAMKADLTGGSFRPRHDPASDSVGTSMRASHTVPNLRREMAAMSICTSVLHAIDLPLGLSHNAEEWLTATATDIGTSDDLELLVFGSVHPLTRDPGPALDAQQSAGCTEPAGPADCRSSSTVARSTSRPGSGAGCRRCATTNEPWPNVRTRLSYSGTQEPCRPPRR